MGIENKYELKKGYIGITDPCEPRVLLARGFSEGVKAANEDWIREIDKHLKTYQGYEYLDSDWWEARKKELEQ